MKKYLKWILAAFVLIVSIKPVLFTWNFIRASYYTQAQSSDAGEAMYDAMKYKPSVYKVFNKYSAKGIENYIVKKAILDSDPSRLKSFPPLYKFNHNFYVQSLLGHIDTARKWELLDDVSLDFLSTPSMNEYTKQILGKISTGLSIPFLTNLADYTWWKGNKTLSRYLISTYSLTGTPFETDTLNTHPMNFQTSRMVVNEILKKNTGLVANDFGDELLRCGDFEDPKCVEMKWFFSLMASTKEFAPGSFTMGADKVGKNNVIRLMGFYFSSSIEKKKSRSRGGIRWIKSIPAENGYYVFSCDIFLHTGSESPSIWLAPGLHEERPGVERGQWKKITIMVNNSSNKYPYFQPLVRMWGTGTLLVDNAVFFKIIKPDFAFEEPPRVFIDDCLSQLPKRGGNVTR